MSRCRLILIDKSSNGAIDCPVQKVKKKREKKRFPTCVIVNWYDKHSINFIGWSD